MRIVSLSPAATEVVFALGLGPSLVGVSHDSDWPPDAAGRPVVTGATRAASPDDATPADDSHHADGSARADVASSGSPMGDGMPFMAGRIRLDEALLAELRPDLVIAPRADEVATSPAGDLRGLVAALPGHAEVLTLDPTSIEGIFHSISTVGAMTGAESSALRLVERLRGRLGRLERRVQRRREEGRRAVRVVALEWHDPAVAAGWWIPEQVRRAGGWELLGAEGGPPTRTSWGDIRDVDPETIVLMPRGRHLEGAVEAWAAARRPNGWEDLEAVHRGQVFAVDAESYFIRPGPRVVEGIALLAEVLDPDAFVETSPLASWTPVD